MRLIVAGGRDFTNDEDRLEEHYLLGEDTLSKLVRGNNVSEIVCGKARGADTFGENWGRANGLDISEFPADWKRHGKGAGPKRNMLMGDYADMLLAFWDGKSRGTKHMIDYMRKLGKPVMVKLYNQETLEDEW
jgi:hypothetical protein